MEAVIALLLVVLIVLVLLRPAIQIVTVHDHQRGVRYRQGRLVGLLPTGPHVAIRPFTEIQLLDGRPTTLTVPAQEILTADGVALKVSLTARYVVADPVAAVTNDQSWVSALYVALHSGIRRALAGRTADDVLAARADLGPGVADAVASDIARIGVELLSVDVRDIMVPGELKRAFAGIVAARREGEAALERARGETAALRSLANAGRMVEDNPGLLQLRVLQQLAASPGNTITLGLGSADGRLPARLGSAGGGELAPRGSTQPAVAPPASTGPAIPPRGSTRPTPGSAPAGGGGAPTTGRPRAAGRPPVEG